MRRRTCLVAVLQGMYEDVRVTSTPRLLDPGFLSPKGIAGRYLAPVTPAVFCASYSHVLTEYDISLPKIRRSIRPPLFHLCRLCCPPSHWFHFRNTNKCLRGSQHCGAVRGGTRAAAPRWRVIGQSRECTAFTPVIHLQTIVHPHARCAAPIDFWPDIRPPSC